MAETIVYPLTFIWSQSIREALVLFLRRVGGTKAKRAGIPKQVPPHGPKKSPHVC